MDFHYFLNYRLRFIEEFYDKAAEPFVSTMRKIDRVEAPYTEVDPEGGESPYQGEWNDGCDCLDVLGQECIGILAVSLRLYLDRYVARMTDWGIATKYERQDKKGWLNGYRRLFREQLAIKWERGPANLEILEQTILGRARGRRGI